ncbi:MAG: exodeoxyribonuclease III [Spirochaetota bacterium]
MKRILSWNVNGIRAVAKKGFLDWLEDESPDIMCLQETKAQPEQLSEELVEPAGYHAHWASAAKKGYSGVAVFSKEKPLEIAPMGLDRFDDEGRVLQIEFADFVLINAYFPNSQDGGKRLDYKLDFCESMQRICDDIGRQGKPLVLCGDYNVAHRPIDLARPKENEKNPGYLPEERAWMDGFIGAGYVDTFRKFTADGGHYTWWSYFTKGRERNVGWRIDYHFVNSAADALVSGASIMADVMGSDHCPVELELGVGET